MRSAGRCLIIAITIASWIATLNHCALRAFEAKSEAISGCPFHSKQSNPQPKSPATECCKVLRAISSTPAKNLTPAVVDVSFGEFVVVAPPKISIARATLDTGPPGKTLFAQLSRSLRAHAPPSLA